MDEQHRDRKPRVGLETGSVFFARRIDVMIVARMSLLFTQYRLFGPKGEWEAEKEDGISEN